MGGFSFLNTDSVTNPTTDISDKHSDAFSFLEITEPSNHEVPSMFTNLAPAEIPRDTDLRVNNPQSITECSSNSMFGDLVLVMDTSLKETNITETRAKPSQSFDLFSHLIGSTPPVPAPLVMESTNTTVNVRPRVPSSSGVSVNPTTSHAKLRLDSVVKATPGFLYNL